jgi:hypothetical protein
MKRGRRVALLCSACLVAPRPAAAADINQQLTERIEAVQAEHRAARQTMIRQINQRFGIDYEALHRHFQDDDRVLRGQRAIVARVHPDIAIRRERAKAEAILTSPDYRQYANARLVLDNELERNHLLRARGLQAYEGILDDVIKTDPLLTYFFRSSDAQERFGLLLSRVKGESHSLHIAGLPAVHPDP